MTKNLLGITVPTKPHKIVSVIVSFMLDHKKPLTIEEIEAYLLQSHGPDNLRSRINRSLNNTPELVKVRQSDQSRIFSIELQYENIKVIKQGEKYSLSLISGTSPAVRVNDFTNENLREYINRKNKIMNPELYELKKKFLQEWSIERLQTMTLIEYTNLEKTSFCYWLEHITRDLGSIVGGSSYKFGIYERSGNSEVKEESNRTTDGDYAWFKKYGLLREDAFESIREILLKIANSAQNNELANIENIDLGFAYKWKIAFLYGDYNVINIFKEKAIRKVAVELEIEESQLDISQLHSEILNKKPIDEDYYDFTRKYWRLLNEGRFIDVKEDFAQWLNVNTFDSYRSYLGSSIQDIVNRLEEIDAFFFGIDLFKVDESQVEKLKRELKKRLSKKERIKNPEFVEYDLKHSNGIPKAVIGKNNYFKFLDEKFKINNSFDPTFFTQEEFELIKVTRDVKNYPVTPELTKAYADLKLAYVKVESWMNSIQSSLFIDGETHIVKKPTNQANRFDGYLWGKIYPSKRDHNDKWLAITVGLDENYYTIKIDTVGLNERDEIRIQYIKYRGDYNNSKIVKLHDKKRFKNWEELLSQTEKDVKELMNYFNDIRDMKSNSNESTSPNNSTPLNQILYGPPGTGKTYTLKKEYFSKYISKETSLTKEKHFENVVKECSWWQVIAIALLEIGKSKVSDIYNNKWVQQKVKLSNSKTVRQTIWGKLQAHTIESCEYVNVKDRQSPLLFNKDMDSLWEILRYEVKDQSPELFDIIDSIENFNPNPDKIINRYKFVTFHQSFSYEDFIEGIKPILPEGEEVSGDLGYKIENGVLKELCIDARNDPENQYAIFIDEINRGNVSSIFGELITLIETDKRTGCDNEIKVVLPYSKEEFSVPPNLDIYGTMNTADRSVEALDTALRRRFTFVEMMPLYDKIGGIEIDGINLGQLLKVINDRVELLIDRDHTIGHSYFIDIKTSLELANAFNDKIVPLLQEYFYGDYGKIGLVLGKGFVAEVKTKSISFAKFDYDDSEDFKTAKYELKKVTEDSILEVLKMLLGDENTSSEE